MCVREKGGGGGVVKAEAVLDVGQCQTCFYTETCDPCVSALVLQSRLTSAILLLRCLDFKKKKSIDNSYTFLLYSKSRM